MAGSGPVRLILCVDGHPVNIHGNDSERSGPTNVYRIYTSIRTGQCYDPTSGRTFLQRKQYIESVGSADSSHASDKGIKEQIRQVYEECCKLNGPENEVWLYGFSRGAYVVRAAAGLLHHLNALTSAGEGVFQEEYDQALASYKRMRKEPDKDLTKETRFLGLHTRPGPTIQFIGVLDTIRALAESDAYDIGLNDSTMHLRQALSIHESRKHLQPECLFPVMRDRSDILVRGSFIQAWFAGNHADVGGSAPKGGLALYPLQWMLLESRAQGLRLEFSASDAGSRTIDNPLQLVFPLGADLEKAAASNWSCTSINGVTTTMQDFRAIHEKGKYAVHIQGRRTRFRPTKKREPFDDTNNLNGVCPFAPQGTILHPSVYLVHDQHASVAYANQEHGFREAIEWNRERALGTSEGKIVQGFWIDEATASGEDAAVQVPTAIRVLVCGNTGVGKSTLINKVFGVAVTESSDRERGIHDVNKEITFEGRPDLVVHDSGGFEAGRVDEIEAIESFLQERANTEDVHQRLHMIWFCLPLTENRPKQASTGKLFEAISKYAGDIPIVIVATKSDTFTDQKEGEFRRRMKREDRTATEEEIAEYSMEEVAARVRLIEEEMLQVPGGRLDACVAVSTEDDKSIVDLTKTTAECFSTEVVRLLYISAQTCSIELKVSSAISEVMRVYKHILRSATIASVIPLGTTINRTTAAVAICKIVLKCFGLPTVSNETAVQVVKANVWDEMGSQALLAFAEVLTLVGAAGSAALAGAPAFLGIALINVPLVIPATTRLFLMLAGDLILILSKSFQDATDRRVGQPQEKDLLRAARQYRSFATAFHKQIGKAVPRRNFIASYQVGKVSKVFEEEIESFREKMSETDYDLKSITSRSTTLSSSTLSTDDDGFSMAELDGIPFARGAVELEAKELVELDAGTEPKVDLKPDVKPELPNIAELEADPVTLPVAPPVTKSIIKEPAAKRVQTAPLELEPQSLGSPVELAGEPLPRRRSSGWSVIKSLSMRRKGH